MRPTSINAGFSMGGYLTDVIPNPKSIIASLAMPENSDHYWMTEAYREASLALGSSSPNPAVGCIIVKNGVEIARGHTQAYRGLHAERSAISKVSDLNELRGATLYVTLEPCAHHGHQPPCCELVKSIGFERVVIGTKDPDARVSGRGSLALLQSGVKISEGILDAELTALNLPFFATRSSGRPFFALKWAQTLDGQLADDLGYSRWISSTESRAYTHTLRQKYDAILVGAGTYLADLPKLDVRECTRVTRAPLQMILDPRSNFLKLTREQEQKINQHLAHRKEPVFLFRPENAEGEVNLKNVIDLKIPSYRPEETQTLIHCFRHPHIEKVLGKPLQSVFVEGGPKTISQFMEAGLSDALHVFVGSKMTGGDQYRIRSKRLLADAHQFNLVASQRLGGDIMLEYISQNLVQHLS